MGRRIANSGGGATVQLADMSASAAALREATRKVHKQVEALMMPGREADLARYYRSSISLAQFLSSWEPLVMQVLQPGSRPWFVCRRRSVLSKRDLEALCLELPASLPRLEIELPTPAAAWGSVFVMEILALSSGRAAARLRDLFNIGPHNGGAYFGSRDDANGVLWREFDGLLDAMVQGPQRQSQACSAALQTYRALASVLRSRPSAASSRASHLHPRQLFLHGNSISSSMAAAFPTAQKLQPSSIATQWTHLAISDSANCERSGAAHTPQQQEVVANP